MDRLLKATHRVGMQHFWFRGLRGFLRPLLERAVREPRTASILDCGCGTGVNLPLFSRYGSVCAVDLNEYGVGLARAGGFARCARATVASLPFRDRTFDLVTSIDVLVCLDEDDERRAVEEMYRVLKPGGAAILNLAAMQILHGDHSVLAQERRRYDRPRVRRLLTDAGFLIERLTHTNASLFPIVFAQRTLQRIVGTSPADGTAEKWQVPPAPVNEMLTGILALESLALRVVSFPFGSSLLCLARKPL